MIRLLLLAVSICQAASFVAPLGRRRSATVISLRYSDRRERDEDEPQNYYDDFADYSSPSSSQPPSLSSRRSASPPTVPEDVFARSLERRRADVQRKDEALLVNWGTGVAKTYGAFTINERFYEQQNSPEQQREQTQLPFDWVRRLDLGAYPRVACGSAHGGLFVADLEAKKLVAEAPNAHSSASNGGVDSLDEKLKNLIYGAYDGGGPLSIAMHGTSIVASSGREGGVKLHKVMLSDAGKTELLYVGDVPSLQRPLPGVRPTLITCMKFDSAGRLYLGGQDGLLRVVTFPETFNGNVMEVRVLSAWSSVKSTECTSAILGLDLSEDLDLVATAHANGNACLHTVSDERSMEGRSGGCCGSLIASWNPFTFSSSRRPEFHARSVAFASAGTLAEGNLTHSLVVGGGNGEIYTQEISREGLASAVSSAADDEEGGVQSHQQPVLKSSTIQQIQPSHQGPVLSLATRPGGILVSAGHDGMIRVTKLWPTPTALYGLGGYKVWIGSVCVDDDGRRLVSDGRDDLVVMHDFGGNDE
mmetsp:Transcript_26121/g.62074  ORF Transcript_26121/g.62074 Transcript_26121/m.62074 type:complete len:532 (+) Transcript_26121:258-1853(+)